MRTGAHVRDVLITGGATRNPIDSMRYISAHSSGRTSQSLAQAMVSSGASVHFLASPEAQMSAPSGAVYETFESTRDLLSRMNTWLLDHPEALVIHAAAVGDYEVEEPQGKIPSGSRELTLHLRPAPKILDKIRSWAPRCFLISFKAAAPDTQVDELQSITAAQLERTNSDIVFGNTIGNLDQDVVLTIPTRSLCFRTRAEAIHELIRRAQEALET